MPLVRVPWARERTGGWHTSGPSGCVMLGHPHGELEWSAWAHVGPQGCAKVRCLRDEIEHVEKQPVTSSNGDRY
ncbi:hypothetical protein LguiA_010475 [Lonicera macranthoides]